MITEGIVRQMRDLWALAIKEVLQGDLDVTHRAMEQAGTEAAFRTLQGKAAATRALMNYPEHLATLIDGVPEAGFAGVAPEPERAAPADFFQYTPPEFDGLQAGTSRPAGIPVDDEDDD